MRIGYCSPFNPMKSGISDFSEELISVLAKYAEVVVFSPVKPSNIQEGHNLEIHLLRELDNEELRGSLDIIVYHVGNNPVYHGEIVDMLEKYPGVVEIHEIGLHHLFADRFFVKQGKEEYLKAVRYCHGQRGGEIAQAFFEGKSGTPWDEHGLDMCMARCVIEPARAVITHSEMAKQMVLGIRNDMPITKILLHAEVDSKDYDTLRTEARKKLNIMAKRIVFGAFGFVPEAKRIIPIFDALVMLRKKTKDFTFLVVGENLTNIDFVTEAQKRGLDKNVIITDFVPLEQLKLYMAACDFCLNLRYPTQGETSASVHRMLGMGKPIVVTDIGSFSEYPDDIVLKVRYDENEVNDIYEALQILLNNSSELDDRKKKAYEYAKEYCELDKNAKRYVHFLLQILYNSWSKEHTDTLIDRITELGLAEEEYVNHMEERLTNVLECLENKYDI